MKRTNNLNTVNKLTGYGNNKALYNTVKAPT